ncbi:MAG: PA0069 family radical SAM protein [Rhodospirillaceae bacterium]|nr:PA0069 family radical SAM protein [Rhodospirillaceae bacterium]MDD9927575.1 PA0069 family radical SAM protein [Rhodospirillaceae bacterium]
MDTLTPTQARKGRGAASNRTGRFEAQERVHFDDGWEGDGEAPPPLRTTVGIDSARRAIAYNESPDVPFDRSINPYRGCEHGCIYCFARPTHAYYGLSPGLDFETRLFQKPDAPERLAEELRKPSYKPAFIALGANTDPYQPIERNLLITRRILQVLANFRHPYAIVTKSPLVIRDIDLIGPMAEAGLATVSISVTTLDRVLARQLEPRAPTPAKRLAAIRTLSETGIPTCVLAAPMIPALNDCELESILATAKEAGARYADYTLLRLPLEIRDLFIEWLQAHYPDRAQHVMTLVRDTRGGADYDSTWGQRRTGTGIYADMLQKRFLLARRKLGMDQRPPALDTSQFRPPPAKGDQLSLL